MSLGECVYACRHPLWGGEGTCITGDDASVGDRCECDEGFVTCDSFGSPSCVSKQAIIWVYVAMAAMGTISLLSFLWHLQRRRYMQEIARRSPKGVIRLRMLIPLSLSAAGTTVVATIAMARRGEASLWDGGMFYVYYSFSYPLIMFACMELLELWLNCLPSQMVSPGSAMAKLKRDGKEKNLFVWMGVSNAVLAALIGPLSTVFRQRVLITVLHGSILFSSPLMVGSIVMVAVNLTKAINKASTQAHQAWHEKAKRSIWKQVCVFVVTCTMFTAAVGVLELSEIGRRTPIIPFMAMYFAGMAGLVLTVHSSRPAAERVLSPVATSRCMLLSSPPPSRVFSGKLSPMLSPRVLLGKTSALLSPRFFSGGETPVVAYKSGGENKKEGGDACKEGGDVDAASPTAPKAGRKSGESKDKLPSVGGFPIKIVPTVSLADSSA